MWKYQEFTSNGTWIKPSNVSRVYVTAVGGGGGGAGGYYVSSSNYFGGGGGGGGSTHVRIPVAVTANVTVTIGSGGTGGAIGSSSTGTNGGNTSFGSLVAYGGFTPVVASYYGGKGGGDNRPVNNLPPTYTEGWLMSVPVPGPASSVGFGTPGGTGGQGGYYNLYLASSGQSSAGIAGGPTNSLHGVSVGTDNYGGGGGSSAYGQGGAGGVGSTSPTVGGRGAGGGGGSGGVNRTAGAAGGDGWCLVEWEE